MIIYAGLLQCFAGALAPFVGSSFRRSADEGFARLLLPRFLSFAKSLLSSAISNFVESFMTLSPAP